MRLAVKALMIVVASASFTATVEAVAPKVCFVNVRHYGVRGNGVADDTAALQGVFDKATKGSTIYLPPGTYLIKSTLRLPSNVTVTGASAEATVLQSKAPLDRLMHGDGVVHLRLADLTLQGNGRDSGKEDEGGIVLTAPKQAGEWPLDLTLERVRIAGFLGSGVVALGSNDRVGVGLTVRDCSMRDLGRHAVLAYYCKDLLVDHCNMLHLGGSGTIFPRVADVTVRGCTVRDTGLQQWGHGIEVGDESCGFVIENNVVSNSGDHAGILIEQAAWRGVIANNRVIHPRYVGIMLNNKPAQAGIKGAAVKEVRVVGNLIDMGQNRDRPAMLVYGDTTFLVEDCSIEGNTLIGGGLEMHYVRRGIIARNFVRDAAKAGMELVHHRQVTIADNQVRGCGQEGIWVHPYAEVFTNGDLTITGNTLQENGRASPGKAAGLRLEKVSGARVLGNRLGAGHSVGIEAMTCDGLIVLGNDLRGNGAGLHVDPAVVVGQNLE